MDALAFLLAVEYERGAGEYLRRSVQERSRRIKLLGVRSVGVEEIDCDRPAGVAVAAHAASRFLDDPGEGFSALDTEIERVPLNAFPLPFVVPVCKD